MRCPMTVYYLSMINIATAHAQSHCKFLDGECPGSHRGQTTVWGNIQSPHILACGNKPAAVVLRLASSGSVRHYDVINERNHKTIASLGQFDRWTLVPCIKRNKNPFSLSSLPAFLRGSGAMVVKATLFGCGYAALGCPGILSPSGNENH